MTSGMTFQRKETKFLLNEAQYAGLIQALRPVMQPDAYGLHTICNVYYDTPDDFLIRDSLQQPPYKEKLRLRSYGLPGPEDTVYLELKKKVKGIVYKRRAAMTLAEAEAFTATGDPPGDGQILRELAYFIRYYHPLPKLFLAYDRVAWECPEDPGLRITFDRRIRSRRENVSLSLGDKGRILSPEQVLMELKVGDAYPLWLVRALEAQEILPVSYSKYGKIYENELQERNLTHV